MSRSSFVRPTGTRSTGAALLRLFQLCSISYTWSTCTRPFCYTGWWSKHRRQPSSAIRYRQVVPSELTTTCNRDGPHEINSAYGRHISRLVHDLKFSKRHLLYSVLCRWTNQGNRLGVVDFVLGYVWITQCMRPGLLALTILLRQTQQVGPPMSTVFLRRAEIIRNLSVFTSTLSWVTKPDQGNY